MPTGFVNQLSPRFVSFLAAEGRDAAQANRRFIARNFLLDEGVPAARGGSYARFADKPGPHSADQWHADHEFYLNDRVRVPRTPGARDGLAHAAATPGSVPETFRHPESPCPLRPGPRQPRTAPR